MSEPDRLGSLPDQQYTSKQIERVSRDAARMVVAEPERDAGKVYCPCCRLREARWKRHYVDEARRQVHFFVYCTQCHKTGVRDVDLAEVRRRGCATPWIVLAVVGACLAVA